MDSASPKRAPWKSWKDFTEWAQNFSLMQKVLGGFLGVVILVGLLTSLIGTQLARDTIIERARIRLNSDLATAGFIIKTAVETLELKIRLIAQSDKFEELVGRRDNAGLHSRLAEISAKNQLDFLSVTDPTGVVLARSGQQNPSGDLSSDPVIKSALTGSHLSGARIMSRERILSENPELKSKIADDGLKDCMVLESAHPLVINGSVVGVLYGGILLNGRTSLVENISQKVFRGELYGKMDVGYVTIYQGDKAIITTLKDASGQSVFPRAVDQIRSSVLENGQTEVIWVNRNDHKYLVGADPIRDIEDKIIGAIEVGTLEQPIESVIRNLVFTFLSVGLVGVLLMGAISYFLVKWINRPLEQMLHAAKRAAEGDLTVEVPVVAQDEVGQLAATFNLMIKNLDESQSRLEQWGKELATKVAAQTGELDQAREQVARVKKLASLEKMADGMAHIMAHISDPLLHFGATEDESGTTSRILVMDSDERVLDICQRIFESEGFDVDLTRSFNEALDQLERQFYDVIIAEIDVPDISGYELLKEIKFRQPDIVVILTAPFKATEEALETVKLGAFDYIPKPFGPHQILLMVYTALQTRQALKQTRKQHAEQRAEKIFQRLPVAIALADEQHRVVYHNRAFVELASPNGDEEINGQSFSDLIGVDPLDKSAEEEGGFRWLKLDNVGRTAKLYNFELPEEDLRVLMLLDITDTVMRDHQVDVFKAETISKAQQVIHQQMRVAQEIAGLLGETTAETKAALFELIKLAREEEAR